MELGEQIATLREEQALTQAELAEAARISPSTLSQIESGRVPSPHVGTVRKIARALGVEPAELRRAKEPVPLGKAPREVGPAQLPNSIEELLERRHARTRHLADPNLKATLDQRPLEDVLQIVREASEEIEAIGPEVARFAQLRDSLAAMRLYSEVSRKVLIVRFALPTRRGQKFAPASPELGEEIDETTRLFEESWETAGVI